MAKISTPRAVTPCLLAVTV